MPSLASSITWLFFVASSSRCANSLNPIAWDLLFLKFYFASSKLHQNTPPAAPLARQCQQSFNHRINFQNSSYVSCWVIIYMFFSLWLSGKVQSQWVRQHVFKYYRVLKLFGAPWPFCRLHGFEPVNRLTSALLCTEFYHPTSCSVDMSTWLQSFCIALEWYFHFDLVISH